MVFMVLASILSVVVLLGAIRDCTRNRTAMAYERTPPVINSMTISLAPTPPASIQGELRESLTRLPRQEDSTVLSDEQ